MHALISVVFVVHFGVIIIATSTHDSIYIYYSLAISESEREFGLFVLLVLLLPKQQRSQQNSNR